MALRLGRAVTVSAGSRGSDLGLGWTQRAAADFAPYKVSRATRPSSPPGECVSRTNAARSSRSPGRQLDR